MSNDKPSEHEMFVTEFSKKGFGIVDYLQGQGEFFYNGSDETNAQIRNESRGDQKNIAC